VSRSPAPRRQAWLVALVTFPILLLAMPAAASAGDPPPPVAWTSRFDGGLRESMMIAADSAVDGKGSLFVTGYQVADAVTQDYDYVTMKLDASGAIAWTARWDGPGGTYDEAKAIVVDAGGDVYVTGTGYQDGTLLDIVTIKYAGDTGKQLWAARYNSAGRNRDEGVDIAIAGDGQMVVVTGNITFPDHDIQTIAYDPAGTKLWSARYGVELVDEKSKAVTVDAGGNVLVTGSLDGGMPDYPSKAVTLKYGQSGAKLWEALYDEPLGDAGAAIDTDSSGNVYVGVLSGAPDSGTDYVTVKYGPEGAELWHRRYIGPGTGYDKEDQLVALDVDASGSVFVTGTSDQADTSLAVATVKYDTNGVEQWSTRKSEQGYGYFATDIVADGSGGAYVGAERRMFVKNDQQVIHYDGTGAEGWVQTADKLTRTAAIALDPGGVYLAGATGKQYGAVKLSAAGATLWSTVSSYGPAWDSPVDIALDGARNVIVAGTSTVKYGPGGNELWRLPEASIAMTVDPAGSTILVRSFCCDSNDERDFGVVKVGGDGTILWSNHYGQQGIDEPVAVTTGPTGDIYVAGTAGKSLGFGASDIGVLRLAPDGSVAWATRYDASTSALPFSAEVPAAIQVGPDGIAYVTGASMVGTDLFNGATDFLTLKLDGSGAVAWARRYDGPAAKVDEATAIAVDPTGSVYVAGCSAGNGTFGDYATVKYDASGAQLWAARYDGAASDFDSAMAVRVGAGGDVTVSGEATVISNPTAGAVTDVVTIRYGSAGNQLWVADYDAPGGGSDRFAGLELDSQGGAIVEVAGNTGASGDYITLRYDATGQPSWVETYDGPAANLDAPAAIARDAFGSIYVTGRSDGGITGYDYATIKYLVDTTPPVVTITSPVAGATYLLGQTVTPAWTAVDPDGGPVTTDAPKTVDTTTMGAHTFTVSAVDGAGNRTTESVEYSVAFASGGIGQPVNGDGSSIFKAGSTIPLKFSVTGQDGRPATGLAPRLSLTRLSGSVLGTELETQTPAQAMSGGTFRETVPGGYVYNLSTKGMAKGTYRADIDLGGGARLTVRFSLR
jgi:hypothetical protein